MGTSAKNIFYIGLIALLAPLAGFAQNGGSIPLLKARFITGNNALYSSPTYNDSSWETQQLGDTWQSQGHAGYHGYAWYRIHVAIPSSLKTNAFWKDSLRIFLAHVNDVDETFLNGESIGHIGSFPTEAGGYVSKWPAIREYHLPLAATTIHWDADNVIAVKVYDGGGSGGIFMGQPYIDVLEKINGLFLQADNRKIMYKNGKALAQLDIANLYNVAINGSIAYAITDEANGKEIEKKEMILNINPFEKKAINIEMPNQEGISIQVIYVESSSKLNASFHATLPYILTPPVAQAPSIHSAGATAVQPGHPFIYKISATGKPPLQYTIKNLPAGLQLNTATGLVTGSIANEGDYAMQVIVKNNTGTAQKKLIIKAGKLLALTPPMGWNSWNCWGTSVSDEKVRSSAQSLIDKGLASHGWNYINVDDGWEAKQRLANGDITTNEKFADMKKLGDFLHGNGLRFGIYSSPGTHTCGGFLGSWQHELADANTYASWGIDYLKYDLCSYIDSMKNNISLAGHQLPYKVMQAALARQNRDIVYSICQYGIKDVWKWGEDVNGNLWRTTEDIEDTWQSILSIGFTGDTLYKYAKPGRWNDPDMLTVGMVGWGENLHPSRLTPDEQYTQVSLWSMLSAPLLIGCDINSIDDFTLSLLTNDEVIAVDQDVLGRQAKKLIDKDSIQVWVKEMADGSMVAAIFNMGASYKNCPLSFRDIGLRGNYKLRDLWRQKDMGNNEKSIQKKIAPHGVYLIKLTAQ